MYSYGRHNIYLNANVVLAHGCVLHEDVVIGNGTSIGANSQLSHSSIGHNCHIGENVTIKGSYIWNNVTVESNCTIRQAILCDGVVVKSNVQVEPGCILSYGVVVGPDFTVKAGSRLTTKHQAETSFIDSEWSEEEEGEAEKQQPCKTPDCVSEEVGKDGRGFLWHPPSLEEEEDSDHLVVEKWPFEEETVCSSGSSPASSRSSSPVPLLMDDQDDTDIMTGQPAELLLYVKNAISHFETLLQHYIKGAEAEVTVLRRISECARQHPNIMAIFPKVLLLLYHADVIEESAILTWYSEFESSDSTLKKQEILTSVRPVIEWLQTAEETSSDEEED